LESENDPPKSSLVRENLLSDLEFYTERLISAAKRATRTRASREDTDHAVFELDEGNDLPKGEQFVKWGAKYEEEAIRTYKEECAMEEAKEQLPKTMATHNRRTNIVIHPTIEETMKRPTFADDHHQTPAVSGAALMLDFARLEPSPEIIFSEESAFMDDTQNANKNGSSKGFSAVCDIPEIEEYTSRYAWSPPPTGDYDQRQHHELIMTRFSRAAETVIITLADRFAPVEMEQPESRVVWTPRDIKELLYHEKILKHTTLMDSMLFRVIPHMKDTSMRKRKARETLPALVGAIAKQRFPRLIRPAILRILKIVRREGRGFWQIVYIDRDSFCVSDHDRSECIMINPAR
jgi:hypothetical protein